MPEVQDDAEKKATGQRTVIRRRARTVVAKPRAGKKAVEAKKGVEEKKEGAALAQKETKDKKAAKPEAAAEKTAKELLEAKGKKAPARGKKAKTGEKAPSEKKKKEVKARIISKPAPGSRLPKQDLVEDDIVKDLFTQSQKEGEGHPREDLSKKRSVKRRQEVSRKALQQERDSFGRMNRHRSKKKKTPSGEIKQTEITTPKAIKRVIRMEEQIVIGDLAKRMGIKASELIKKLLEMGVMVTVNQSIDFDTATLLSSEFSYEVLQKGFEEESVIDEVQDQMEDLKGRAPIVAVMGHVDHGKTTLLDSIRKTDVAQKESGGITQHIGAYKVHLADGHNVVFLDTPGHAAFTAMRARGAKVTDIIILVVAADDGVMPQTIEAIDHARAANVPIIVAVNKIDKPGADLEKIKKALTEHELIPEEWGGTTMVLPVSAKKGEGLQSLLESLVVQAEIMELKANPDKRAKGVVVEARLEKGRGSVVTLMVTEGTLHSSDNMVIGQFSGRVRAMTDYLGKPINTAGPATPVEIQGITGVPEAGEFFTVVKDEKEAKMVSEHRARKLRESELLKSSRVSLDQLYEKIKEGEVGELKVIIKSDVQGSAEALEKALVDLSTEEVKCVVLHSGAGAITESDVNLAAASDSLLVGFSVRPEPKARALAEKVGVSIRIYSIIYEVLEEMKALMTGKLKPTLKENLLGRAEVRETFRISKVGLIAGCMVADGKIQRSAKVRLLRDHVVIHEGKLSSLKRFKDDAREVTSGLECGMGIENYNDIKEGDVIESFEVEEISAQL